MKRHIFRAILAVALAVEAASLVLIVWVLHDFFEERVTEELAQSAAYIARGIEIHGGAYLTGGLPEVKRITWIDSNGAVLFDNWEDSAGMGDHADRTEVRDALLLGRGTAVRRSDTLGQKTAYYALRLSDGTVLRLAEDQDSVWMMVLQALRPVFLMVALALCLALWLAGRVAQRLVAPINAIDPEDPGGETAYEELAPLVGKLRDQNRRIRRQMADLVRQREEFNTITEHMQEGLLVIDRDTRLLSCNKAALELLGAEETPLGESVLALDREAGFRRCVEEALAGRAWETLLDRDGVCRQVFASPAERDGAPSGAVLVILDVTERERREALRREFTANVSHELKTPLTTILGTAEILENGMVREADIPHFAGNIRREAQRLIDMVDDIIQLSRLDEGGFAGSWEAVDLYSQAARVLEQLAPAAERRQVTMTLEGGPAPVWGVPQIVEEIVYNLCDNAVAYNRQGGAVAVTVENGPEGAVLSVRDTGVGIPPEERERVFERFYRADKSHSGGGTGLGLSIVKHGAAYLGARVALESEPGKGSAFTVTFPLARS